MTMTDKFLMTRCQLLWPALFIPYALDREEPKYRATFTVPEGVVPPTWMFVKGIDSKYGYPQGTRVVNVSSRNRMPVFGIDRLHLQMMKDHLVNIDGQIHNATCDVILTAHEDRSGKFWPEAVGIDLSSALIVCPDFESLKRGL